MSVSYTHLDVYKRQGKMTVEVEGKEYTLQQAAKFLENSDRKVREAVYYKIQERRKQDEQPMHDLYSSLIAKRHQIAINACLLYTSR